ncbi:MAGUK p55 subfamily member 4 [Onychostoma macrolepis]|uniref:MAGUK p55 subfamily member 4 n=1 Tax=Onychostoma macrolepis TaxID=369639 RepID=UPI00272AC9B2|nr:MAGUK p55 subfamily member 4 [Onychostoma macrolepis]XP_058644211.1 MAGUK p55 subfamily member 4 [Onychostoma macrolepis]
MRQSMEEDPVMQPGHDDNDVGLAQILTEVVEEVRLSIDRDINGADLLYSLLSAPWLYSLLRVYECLVQHSQDAPSPYLSYSLRLSQEIMASVPGLAAPSFEAQELYILLKCPHMQALLSAHDSVAQRDYGPVLLPLPDKLPDNEEAMRIVCLVKNKQPLGATIRKNEKTGNIFIARVIHGGLADRSGLLHPGDKLVEVNGQKVRGLQPEHIIQRLVQSQGNILFKVIPNTPQPTNSQPALHVRAMVDYSPLQDPTIPCPDAGMAFSKGDLLKIVDQTDIRWWQARKLHSASLCCGLIPSTNQFKCKQRELWWSQPYQAHTCIRPLSATDVGEEEISDENKCIETDGDFEFEEGENGEYMQGLYIAGFRHSLRVWRRKSNSKRKPSCYSCGVSSCHNTSATLYEEVVHYQRHIDDPPRLIVLIGPSGVGVNELRRRLIKINPNTYQGPISHTTRSQKMGEKNGREYYFVTKEVFAYMVVNHKFLEYGEHNGHMYGTSLDSVQDVLDNGKICVIDLEPHCIHSVRSKKLKPYIIYVRPPSPARMKQTRKDPHFLSNRYIKRYFSDKDFEEIEEASRTMEAKYRQYFDCVIVNDDLQDSCMDLFTAIQHAQEEPQWIPASWFAPDHP